MLRMKKAKKRDDMYVASKASKWRRWLVVMNNNMDK